MNRITFTIIALTISALACRITPSEPRRLDLYPSPTILPTQTERIVVWTSTPVSTYTPVVKEVTSTPEPGYLCVMADEAVYLRPSADLTGYPIAPLPNGTRLLDLGGRKGNFAFVSYRDQQGWVSLNFVNSCE